MGVAEGVCVGGSAVGVPVGVEVGVGGVAVGVEVDVEVGVRVRGNVGLDRVVGVVDGPMGRGV